jgi:hypothetical protein
MIEILQGYERQNQSIADQKNPNSPFQPGMLEDECRKQGGEAHEAISENVNRIKE